MENQQSPWFEGSVGDAVAKATNEKLLFLSFIYDDDENSNKMRELLSDGEISTLMKSKSVAIEMKKGSETYNLFSQIFPTFFCPCLVFIQNGRLIYFLNSEATKEKVIENINKYSDLEQSNPTVVPNENTNTNANTINNEMKESVEEIQKEKELNDEEKKTKGIEELKDLQQDNDDRKDQILEQNNKNQKERENKNNTLNNNGSSSRKDDVFKLLNERSESMSDNYDVLVSVRYIDGSLLRKEFKRSQKLSEIRQWIDDTTKERGIYKPYNIETRYPEHQFSYGEESKSLLDLNLDDTDLLICKPVTKVFSENPKQTLEVSKNFSLNFFKDLLLFLFAFILSFNVFNNSVKSKRDKGKEEEYIDDDECENEDYDDESESESQSQGREKRKSFRYRRGIIRMNNYRKFKSLIRVNNPKIN